MATLDVTDVDIEIWEKLLDVGLVAFISHKLEELLREILGNVLLWCPEVLTWYNTNFQMKTWRKANDLKQTLEKEDGCILARCAKIFEWMSGLKATFGELMYIFEAFRKAKKFMSDEQKPILQWEYNLLTGRGIVIDKVRGKSWFDNVEKAAKSIEKMYNLHLTLYEKIDERGGLMQEVNDKRNEVLHHNTRRPCLKLGDSERKDLIKRYTSLIESDLLCIIDDSGTSIKRDEYLKVIKISDWRAILKSYKRLTEKLEDLTTDLNTMTNQSEGFERELQQVEAEKDVAVVKRNQLERDLKQLCREKEQVMHQLSKVLAQHENCDSSITELKAEVAEHKATIQSVQSDYGDLASENNKLKGECQKLKEAIKDLSGQLKAKEVALRSLQEVTDELGQISTTESRVKLGNKSRSSPSIRPNQDAELNELSGVSQKGSESSQQSDRQTEEVPTNLQRLSTRSALQEQQSVSNEVLQRITEQSVVAASQDTAETNDQLAMPEELMSNRALQQSGEEPSTTDEVDSELA